MVDECFQAALENEHGMEFMMNKLMDRRECMRASKERMLGKQRSSSEVMK